MGHPDFGHHIDPFQVLKTVLSKNFTGDSVEIKQAMTEIYETVYGIYNHVQNAQAPPSRKRPFASIAHHKGEDFTETSTYMVSLKLYSELPIYDMWKIDFPTFMKLPSPVVQDMIDLAQLRKAKETQIVNNADQTMRAAVQGQQKSHQQMTREVKKSKR